MNMCGCSWLVGGNHPVPSGVGLSLVNHTRSLGIQWLEVQPCPDKPLAQSAQECGPALSGLLVSILVFVVIQCSTGKISWLYRVIIYD